MSEIPTNTNVPLRYRMPWVRPTDEEWISIFSKCKEHTANGGLVLLIGDRGTGKTRMAAEIIRDRLDWMSATSPSIYTTAMGVFLRIRDAYAKRTPETEGAIVDELSKCRLLVIDEIQERSNSEWEDRIITHIIDRRYSGNLPSIIIGNLLPESMERNLGESVVSRASETGGIIKMTGKSHRIR